MATPDMDVIKDIPGYKVILKAILKSQIQQLVEQLSSHTEEETVILTASVSDGTLSHMGSDSGKFFLNDHEDIKSQFLGFCLKRSHEKKLEKDREEEEALIRQQMKQSRPHPVGPPVLVQGPSGMMSSRQRFPGNRHQPYGRTGRKSISANLNQRTSTPKTSTASISDVIKVERPEDNENSDKQTFSLDASQSASQSNFNENSSNNPNQSASETSADATLDTQNDLQRSDKISLGSDLSNLVDDTSQVPNDSDQTDTDVSNVKIEPISESDMELEIIGIEPGRPMDPSGQQTPTWGQNTSQEQDWSGASEADLQGYTSIQAMRGKTGRRPKSNYGVTEFNCTFCTKKFNRHFFLERHLRIHTGEKPFKCSVCGKAFNAKGNMLVHYVRHFPQTN